MIAQELTRCAACNGSRRRAVPSGVETVGGVGWQEYEWAECPDCRGTGAVKVDGSVPRREGPP